ncbi:hypothetical protein Pint_14349 [Pistacia integerrima]|uniref:Uncharacterized protein n=1 Tax=Pistacia integerrima TaxID=434235 RepID=A0ACC0YA81_9ROSI|nr:hypothetical protein Pint_14349 [Pistacia integerrima]
MAGLATTAIPFTKTAPCFSSSESKFFGLHFHIRNPNHLFLVSISSSPHQHHNISITARYGGGGGRGGPRFDSRRSRRNESDDEQVFDIDGIRSATVRLIDAKQNMVGVVSKSEAIQMAEDAELDLVIVSPEADPPVVRIMDYEYVFCLILSRNDMG